MFAAVNTERARLDSRATASESGERPDHLAPLVWNEGLAQIASEHARDMATRGYFAHDTPEGKTPDDRVRDAGIPHDITVENIYQSYGDDAVRNAIEWFMSDPVHRQTILDPHMTDLGVGVAVIDQQTFFVLDFIRRPDTTPLPKP